MLKLIAKLIRDVEYVDFNGTVVKVPAGEVVDVSMFVTNLDSVDVTGKSAVQSDDSFVATKSGISFDVEADDFITLNAS